MTKPNSNLIPGVNKSGEISEVPQSTLFFHSFSYSVSFLTLLSYIVPQFDHCDLHFTHRIYGLLTCYTQQNLQLPTSQKNLSVLHLELAIFINFCH